MNPRLKNLKKIEFPVTYACTGRCKHCSEGDHRSSDGHIDGDAAAKVIRQVSGLYNIETVLAFGGEPLLYAEDVYKIMSAAKEAGIPRRVVITNGYFSRSEDKIRGIAKELLKSGCNDILLSVDAFHQETIPLETVMIFADEIKKFSLDAIRTQPAWIKGRCGDNPYDKRTVEIIAEFEKLGISANGGNIVFPEGNAKKYLSEYFDSEKKYVNPYEENPDDVMTLSISPDGGLLGKNIYTDDILDILEGYKG